MSHATSVTSSVPPTLASTTSVLPGTTPTNAITSTASDAHRLPPQLFGEDDRGEEGGKKKVPVPTVTSTETDPIPETVSGNGEVCTRATTSRLLKDRSQKTQTVRVGTIVAPCTAFPTFSSKADAEVKKPNAWAGLVAGGAGAALLWL